MIIRYKKTRPEVITPTRSNPSDAGLDLYFCPEDNKNVLVPPRASVVLETGLIFEIPSGFMLEIKNRSSVASKKQLLVGACVCDPGYSGTVKINLINVGRDIQTINVGDKIAQAVLVPVIHFRAQESEEIYDTTLAISNRKDGGFGSTDTKDKK